jgi:preprotein translocase subunit SecA
VQPPKATLARISFQRFFRLYRKLSGMTGTGWEGRHEFWQVYKVPVVRIPTHKPCIRERLDDQVYASSDRRWAAVVEEIRKVHAEGRPILVGTRSVEASEHLSELLTKEGLDHQVLNAVRHAEEAQIISLAGQAGKITVATNMAGRGTDIKLGTGVPEKGGLHVIATERHESGRVDRQLFGRSGRQGDPGSAVAIVALEDELIKRHANPILRSLLRASAVSKGRGPRRLSGLTFHLAQLRAQSQAARQRRQVLEQDNWLDEFLGFTGSNT